MARSCPKLARDRAAPRRINANDHRVRLQASRDARNGWRAHENGTGERFTDPVVMRLEALIDQLDRSTIKMTRVSAEMEWIGVYWASQCQLCVRPRLARCRAEAGGGVGRATRWSHADSEAWKMRGGPGDQRGRACQRGGSAEQDPPYASCDRAARGRRRPSERFPAWRPRRTADASACRRR